MELSPWARERRVDVVLAGLAAGIVEGTLCNTPMETIQTKLMQDQLSQSPQYRGIFRPIATIAQQQGARGLYQGLAPLLIKVGSNHMVRFSLFDVLREKVERWNQRHDADAATRATDSARDVRTNVRAGALSAGQTWLCGAISGGVSVIANHPFDVLKTNMMSAHRARFHNWLHCAQVLMKEGGGPRALLAGFWPRFIRVCSEMGFVFLFYERISDFVDNHV